MTEVEQQVLGVEEIAARLYARLVERYEGGNTDGAPWAVACDYAEELVGEFERRGWRKADE